MKFFYNKMNDYKISVITSEFLINRKINFDEIYKILTEKKQNYIVGALYKYNDKKRKFGDVSGIKLMKNVMYLLCKNKSNNIKMYNSGKLQLMGSKSIEQITDTIETLNKFFSEICEYNEKVIFIKYIMINIRVNIKVPDGKIINLKKLSEHSDLNENNFVKISPYALTYNPLNIIYLYSINKDINIKKMIFDNDFSNTQKIVDRISINIREKGSTIITGFRTFEALDEVLIFLGKLLKDVEFI